MFSRFSRQSSALKEGVDQEGERRQLAPGGRAVRFVVRLVNELKEGRGRLVALGGEAAVR